MKTIAIVGATGNQGFSVAQTFLKLDNWHVRALTRNPSSTTAQSLAAQGAEVVVADLSDIDSLHAAFADAHVIYSNTDFWGPYLACGDSEEAYAAELQHGRNAAIAAAGVATLERYIYSTLGPMKKHSKGKYPHSYHWDSKAEIMEYIQTEMPQLAAKTSYIIIGAYSTNPLFMPRWNPDLKKYQLVITIAKDAMMPIIATKDSTGPFVQGLIEEPPQTRLLAYDSYLSMEEALDVWRRVTGKTAELVVLKPEEMHAQFGIPWEVLDGPSFIEEFGYTGGIENVIHPSQLKTPVKTDSFEEWLSKSNWRDLLSGGKEELGEVVEASAGGVETKHK